MYTRREVGLEDLAQEYFNDPAAFKLATEYSKELAEYYLNGREACMCKTYLGNRLYQLRISIKE